jgi:hypothetical protein
MNVNPSRALIFGDDSSKTGHAYFVYGSLICGESRLPAILKKLQNSLGDYYHEIKWNETRYLNINKRFAGALFDSWSSLSYRCIVVPTAQINDAVSPSERSLLRAKLVFTHLNTYVRTTGHDRPLFHATLDEDEFDPEVQKITLNHKFWRDHGGDYDAFEVVRAEKSKNDLMLQAADLITGAIAWVWNGGLEPASTSNSYVHRLTMASLIAARVRIPQIKKKSEIIVPQGDVRGLGYPTVQAHQKGFSIWKMDLARSKAAQGS